MTALELHLREQLARTGPIPFAEFMRLALYHPEHGYYSRIHQQIGKRGDFMTSVSVGPFFGELLAFQFARWLESLPGKGPVAIVEAGAHDGQLAEDILTALQQCEPQLGSRVEYWIVEPSAARQEVQRQKLHGFQQVRWAAGLAGLPAKTRGVLFSNELLDAMPVHALAWNASGQIWEELGVRVSGERLTWTRLPPSIAPPSLPQELLAVLPDGYIVECSPAAFAWWQEAARSLSAGWLLAIDYGGAFEELITPGRHRGTLRAYAKHRVSDDLLADPGEQDLTAHVNFSEIRRAGELAGWRTETFTYQSQFLTAIARELWARRGEWPAGQVRQFQTLTHPEHLGRPFRVLVQSRGVQ
jgi:SAM-dependent MidA family methyltransferase